jgi:hypothetical protein
MINPVTTAIVRTTATRDSSGPKSSNNCGFFETSFGTGSPGATVGFAAGGGAAERGVLMGDAAGVVGATIGRKGAAGGGGGGGGAENTMVGATAGGVGGNDNGGRFPALAALREPGRTDEFEFTDPPDESTGSVSTGSRQNMA